MHNTNELGLLIKDLINEISNLKTNSVDSNRLIDNQEKLTEKYNSIVTALDRLNINFDNHRKNSEESDNRINKTIEKLESDIKKSFSKIDEIKNSKNYTQLDKRLSILEAEINSTNKKNLIAGGTIATIVTAIGNYIANLPK